MGASRKIPTRTCCACGASGEKASLVRVVRTPEGAVELDPTGRMAGRGAYLCADRACFSKARRTRRLDRALRISLEEEDYDRLEDDFSLRALDTDTGEGTVG